MLIRVRNSMLTNTNTRHTGTYFKYYIAEHEYHLPTPPPPAKAREMLHISDLITYFHDIVWHCLALPKF